LKNQPCLLLMSICCSIMRAPNFQRAQPWGMDIFYLAPPALNLRSLDLDPKVTSPSSKFKIMTSANVTSSSSLLRAGYWLPPLPMGWDDHDPASCCRCRPPASASCPCPKQQHRRRRLVFSLPPTTQRENYCSIEPPSTYAADGRGLMLASSRGVRWRAVPCAYRRGRRWHTAWRRGVCVSFGFAPVVTLRYCSFLICCISIK